MSQKFVFGQQTDASMEVDSDANTFLDNEESSEDTAQETNQVEQKNKEKIANRHIGVSKTVRISPISRNATISELNDFILTAIDNAPVCYKVVEENNSGKDQKAATYGARVAYVVLQNTEDPPVCCTKLNELEFAGLKVEVKVCGPSLQTNTQLKERTNWITLTGLNRQVDEGDILAHIQENTSVTNQPKSVFLSHHPTKKDWSGFAWIECQNGDDATQCVDTLKNTRLKGDRIWCQYKPKRDVQRKEHLEGTSKSLKLCNIHYTLGNKGVKELCAEYGELEKVRVWKSKMGFLLGNANVEFANEEQATKAFDGLHGKTVNHMTITTGYLKAFGKDWTRKPNKEGKKKLLKYKNTRHKMANTRKSNTGKSKRSTKGGRGRGGGPKIA